jgi:hypothetical protein
MLEAENALLNSHSRFSPALGQRMNIQRVNFLIVMLVVALMTTLCGMPAHAAGAPSNSDILIVYGTLPLGTVNRPYNAALAVHGGSAPYNFSLKSGTLPPGVSLNPATGGISGKPVSAGIFKFEVQVTDSRLLAPGIQFFAIGVNGGNAASAVQVSVSPTSTTLSSTSKQQFTATISGSADTAVSWSATAGSVDANGVFTAPKVTSHTGVTVTATSHADPTKSARADISINPANNQLLQITTTGNLPQGAEGNPYNVGFAAIGGTPPYSWNLSAGTMPPGTSLTTNGDFGGTPTKTGIFSFTVTVTDSANHTATGNSSVTVASANNGSGNFDGPAELPRLTVSSAMADTPAPGAVTSVKSGGDLQAALDNAQCGDTIQLQAGATFSGKFVVPAKNCDSNHWIIVRTSSPDSALPAEGQRGTPCYAGIASLPGRPQYSCPNPSNVMAKVQDPGPGSGPFQFAPGANYYRFVGLEIFHPAGVFGPTQLFSGKGSFDHVVVDRSWLHGAPQNETSNGVNLNGATNVAVVDSYFSDFHCVASTGSCIDAHAIGGGTSDTQDGPIKIQNNFLEASGEAVMFGGGEAKFTPADIQITGNHFWKPWQWMPGNANFVGGTDHHPFVVKNHMELKNAIRVLVEANLMDNNWGGFTQAGYALLLTPKNQHTKSGADVCPICQVADITIRYVHISHAGDGIMMATDLSGDGKNGAPALAGSRWSIHDVLLDDINKNYGGGGIAFEIMNGWPNNPLNTVTINHVTAFPDPAGHMLIMGNQSKNAAMYGLVFTNNVMVTTRFPVENMGGGPTSCAYVAVPIVSIPKCFTTYNFTNNALVAVSSQFPPSTWPANNLFPPTIDDVAFVNYKNGNGGNYELQPSSPYKNKGMDNKDLGADIVGLNEALANVE